MPDYTNEIPKECEVSLRHAMEHIKCALECEHTDPEQATHDADMAAKILSTYVARRV